ncbi:TonB-dependent receptor [Tepidiphilus margaritifer]|uniref:TonB-dependent receptor n=1 Tax=Tepidiphilus margaritifer TaxID=203471 RepID=UPI000425778F|nr:TonB-dependent siderophore receptor [Tepidiphilus margaritifer]
MSTIPPHEPQPQAENAALLRPKVLPLGAAMLIGLGAAQPALAQSAESGAADAQVLPTVTVTDEAPAETEGYLKRTTRVGKTLQDPHEIPQAITILTQDLLEDQQVGSLREALRNVSGLTFNAAEGGRSGDNMMLRGFYTFGDMYLDGMRDTAQYNRETFNLESVEVLRGAAAMLYGRGQAGGVINQVSKTPLPVDKYKLTGSVGTEDYREGTADLNKTLGENSALRVNLMKRVEGSWRENPANGDEPGIDRQGAAVSYVHGMGTRDELLLSHYYLKTRDTPDYGVPFDSTTKRPLKRYGSSAFWGTDDTFDDSDTNISTATYTHRFQPGTEWRTSVRFADYDRTYWALAPSAANPPAATGWSGGSKTRNYDYQTVALQSDLTHSLTIAGMRHELLAGFEYLKEDGHWKALRNLGCTGKASPSCAPYYRPGIEDPKAIATDFTGNSYALLAQDTIEFLPQWKLTLGVRRDELDADYSHANSPHLDFGENSYRAGLSWLPSENQHYYLSWSDSFSPTADLYQLSGGEYPPERSDVVELGAKWMLFEGNLSLRAALYRATKEWERNQDLESTGAVLSRKRRTDGLELEAAGRITERWEVFAGLSLMDAEILKVAPGADPRFKGERPRNTPDYTFNLWTTYRFMPHWKAGLGAETKGERYGYSPSAAKGPFVNGKFSPNVAPSYTRWDAMLAYEQPSYTVRLNVRNLFDKVYYDAIYDNGGFVVPGPDRTVILSAEFKF